MACQHDHAYYFGHSWPASRAPRRQQHRAVPDYIIDYRSKRTCSIGFQSRFKIQDFCQDSRFRARFQDFGRDFKISGKISGKFQRFQDFSEDFHRNVRVSDPSILSDHKVEVCMKLYIRRKTSCVGSDDVRNSFLKFDSASSFAFRNSSSVYSVNEAHGVETVHHDELLEHGEHHIEARLVQFMS